MLIVIVIIGIMAALIGLKIGTRTLDDRLQTEAERFDQLLRLAEEESQVKGIPLGLRFTADGYEFLALNDKQLWANYDSGVLRKRTLEAPFYTELHVEGRMVPPAQDSQPGDDQPRKDKKKIEPQVLILPGGEMTAFAVDVKAQSYRSWFHIETDSLGRIVEQRRSEQ